MGVFLVVFLDIDFGGFIGRFQTADVTVRFGIFLF